MFASIGAEFDKTAEYEQKADYHAIKTAKELVELRVDRAVSTMLQDHLYTHSFMEFYRKFFQKHYTGEHNSSQRHKESHLTGVLCIGQHDVGWYAVN